VVGRLVCHAQIEKRQVIVHPLPICLSLTSANGSEIAVKSCY